MLAVAPTPTLAAWKFLGDVYTAHVHARDVLNCLKKHTSLPRDLYGTRARPEGSEETKWKNLIQEIQYFQLTDTVLRLKFYKLTQLALTFQSLQMAAYAVWNHALESTQTIPEMTSEEANKFLFPTPEADLLHQALRFTPDGPGIIEEAHGWLQCAIGTNPRQLGCADPILGPVRAIKLLLPTWMEKPYAPGN